MFTSRRLLFFGLAGAIALGAAGFLSDFVLYQTFVLPQLLPGLRSVPMEWWIGVMVPLLLSPLLLGYASRSVGLVLASASGGTAGLVTYEFVMAHLNQPGHLKSYAVEDPVFFFTTHTVMVFAVVLVVVLVGFGVGRMVHGGVRVIT